MGGREVGRVGRERGKGGSEEKEHSVYYGVVSRQQWLKMEGRNLGERGEGKRLPTSPTGEVSKRRKRRGEVLHSGREGGRRRERERENIR